MLLPTFALAGSLLFLPAPTQTTQTSGGGSAGGQGSLPLLETIAENAGSFVFSSPRFVTWRSPESASTGDLNGDGDTDDSVLRAYDLEERETIELPFAGDAGHWSEVPAGRPLPFLVQESEQGAVDLNGDGDVGDAILALYDRVNETVVVGSVAGQVPAYFGPLLLLQATESEDGRDWNGDGVVFGGVVLIVDPVDASVVGVVPGATRMIRDEDTFLFLVEEDAVFGAPIDLTGDGDTADTVGLVVDARTGQMDIVPVPLDPTNSIVIGPAALYAAVKEGAWSRDLDGDGSQSSTVLVRVDRTTGAIVNTGAQVATFFASMQLTSFGVNFIWLEAGKIDLNGDGDTSDFVHAVYDEGSGQTRSLGLATDSGFFPVHTVEVADGLLAVDVCEDAQAGADLNGDGDATDRLWMLWDVATGSQLLVPYAADLAHPPTLFDDLFLFALSEQDEDSPVGGDLNGDGLLTAGVLHSYRLGDGQLTSADLRVDTAFTYAQPLVFDGQLLAQVSEAFDGVDRTGDGVADDQALVLVSPSALSVRSFGVAVSLFRGPLTRAGRPVMGSGPVVVGQSEALSGQDLNGDGDLEDDFLSVLAVH